MLVNVSDQVYNTPHNERKEMTTEVTESMYNPNGLIALRKPTADGITYPVYTATEIEQLVERTNRLEQRIEHNEKQLGQIIDNLSMEGWYSDSIDKEEVLSDLCEIVGHKPTQTLNWSITVTVSGSSEIELTDVKDFDIRYHLADTLSVDSNDFNTDVDSWDIDYVDSQDWN